MTMTLHGVGASAGIGIGTAVCVREQNLDYTSVPFSGAEQEKARLRAAADLFTQRTQAMADDITNRLGEAEAAILTGQIMMLEDPFMLSQMEEAIDAGKCAEEALDTVCQTFIAMFSGVEDELMRQRAADIGDIRTRMLGILLHAESVDLAALPEGTVLVVHDLTPSMTVSLSKEHVCAILTEVGGQTSHSAILARALEVPAVLGVPGLLDAVQDGMTVAVDGTEGAALLCPDEATLAVFQARRDKWLEERALLQVYRDRDTRTADGRHVDLYANIGSIADAKAAAEAGAEGIGLFRTEFLFMDRTALPDEEEQYQAYAQVSDLMAGKEVIIRTLDVGGDKGIAYLEMEREENPFLGHRAIRYCLDRPDLYRVQLRALLRAGARHGNIKIMLPLVSGVEEVRGARALLEECKAQLSAEGLAFDPHISLGIMVETPAAALIADLLAREADFFSIGTNDLTQYTIAVDRGNAKVEKLYTCYHPAVLRSIRSVIAAGKAAGIPVGMCGEAAADPRMIPLLLAFGLDEFSVSPSSILAARKQIADWNGPDALRTAEQAMALDTAAQVSDFLAQASASL